MSVEVQATSIDAVISKESSCAKGYFADPFLKFFVPEKERRRRSPLINRGYYARFKAFDLVLKRFAQAFPGRRQIVSLGGGSETIWFRLKTAHMQPELYVEIDLPPITLQKTKTILANPDLLNLLSGERTAEDNAPLLTPEYRVLSCDLTNTDMLSQLLVKHCQLAVPTLFLSECVLVYVDPVSSAGVLRTISTLFPENSFVVSYEQILPHDLFGQQMVQNLKSRGCALLGLEAHPDLPSQKRRFLSNGFSTVECMDMKTVYYDLLGKQDRKRIERLEIFDEFEEFFLIMQHYAFTLASTVNSSHQTVLNLLPEEEEEGKA